MEREPLLRARLDAFEDDGAVTAEYAIATIAAVGFAALLVVVLRSDQVRGLLLSLVTRALAMPD
ncbi:DUF4244 domain-containing protein [Amnibacterium setariae]|jgi:hypothetical protein|uniref:DUF4244 domain-containing protein n=1 Tax=Amnibacterium setariae TaxID=2306585 RepID=A0A3A1TZR5_9MICO|nr:DUF4244 domain-containing protein [Amnibacterium setariae]RIX26520.1 DUF4244 domain-containing protein [Amnibacterium setariae]